MFSKGDVVRLKNDGGGEFFTDMRMSNMLKRDMETLVGRKLIVMSGHLDAMDRYVVKDTESGIQWYLWYGCLVPYRRGCVFDV